MATKNYDKVYSVINKPSYRNINLHENRSTLKKYSHISNCFCLAINDQNRQYPVTLLGHFYHFCL